MIEWIDQTDPDAEPRTVLGKKAIPYSTKPAKLPQKAGWYLWHDIDSPHSSMCDVVRIASVSEYRPEWLASIRERGKYKPHLYFNGAGEELAICWTCNNGELFTPSFYAGQPDCDWAPFNFPETKKIRKHTYCTSPVLEGKL